MSKVRIFAVFIVLLLLFTVASAMPASATVVVQLDATDLALSNNDVVAAWGGQTAAGTPTYLTNQTPNGGPAVEFNGADRLGNNVPLSSSGAGDWIVAAVIKPVANGAYHNIVDDDASSRPMLWIDPSENYELNYGGGSGAKASGNGPDGWDIVIADSSNNQLYVNSSTPNATGGSAIPFSVGESFDFFHRDGGQTFQGLVAELRIYNDRADFGGDFAALYDELAAKWMVSSPLDDGGWELVAHMSEGGGMFDGNGELAPDYSYGTFNSNPIASTPDFQRAFPVIADKILFITGDQSIWAIADYGDMRGLIDARAGVFSPNIGFETGVDGVISNSTGNVLSRSGVQEDPWISMDSDHSAGIANQRIVWGEMNYGNGTHQALKNSHGGINVYVKAGNDSDGDGVQDNQDDYPFDGTRSVSCDPGYYGDHECTAAPIGYYVSGPGAIAATACPASTTTTTTASTDPSDCVTHVTPCGPLVAEAASYDLVYSLPIPINADYGSGLPPYSVDNSTSIGSFDRVAYCVELDSQWIWVSLDAFTTVPAQVGVPVISTGAVFQQLVSNMNVESNVPGIVTGTGISTGNIEFWHHCYVIPNEIGIPGASGSIYDFGDDNNHNDSCYGSMQLHNYAAGQTLFAYNSWDSVNVDDLGIGNQAVVHPDWTFARNAATYGIRNMHILVGGNIVLDGDGDGVPDDEDAFPNDPGRTVNCEPGTYGATSCTPAPLGYYVAVAGALEATICPAGTFSDQLGSITCSDAPAGTYVDFEGAAAAIKCAKGYYQPTVGSLSCLPAPIGSYVDILGATTATACPAGSTTAGEASTSLSDCNSPPTADAGGPYNVDEGGSVGLSGSATSDPDGDAPLTFNWDLDDSGSFETAGENVTFSAAGRDGPDSQTVVLQVCDPSGDCGTSSVAIGIDNVAPSGASLSLDTAAISENGTVTLSGSFSDPGTPDTHMVVIDWDDGSGTTTINLTGGERTFGASHQYLDDDPTATPVGTYTIGVSVTDDDLESDSANTSVTVNNAAPEVGLVTVPTAPIDINNQPVSGVSAPFTDIGSLDSHTCTVDYNDGNGPQSGTAAAGICSGPDHIFTEAGVYAVTVEVTDDDTGADSATATSFIVIYDSSGGFVTGGGWINSPEGACKFEECTDLTTGKANFGFVSKYKNGATVPTGKTNFQFKAGDLHFKSTSYDWLVVAGANAKYKGEGTINGTGNYGFMLTATDSDVQGGGDEDTFRIKIWVKGNPDGVVYDNKMGAGDDGYDGTELGGGNIKIHKAKK